MSVTDQLEASLPDGPLPQTKSRQRKSIWQLELTAKKVPRKDLMHFSRQLAVFIQAGIPIIEALEAINEEMSNKAFRAIVDDMIASLKAGSTFADAAAEHATAFPNYYLGILRSAEMTGQLDTVLVQLSGYIERDLEARRKVTSALTYPAVVAAMSVVVVVILVGFVLPKFEKFFASLHTKLPLPTRLLLAVGHFFTNYGIFVVAGIALLTILLFVALRTARGATAKDRLTLRLPVVGDLARHVILERFCRILSSMMQAGVSLPEAMRVTIEATSNRIYKRGLGDARDAMMRGEGLAAPLITTGLFPPSAKQMFRVGENTGTLDRQLATAAVYFERELDYKIKRFTNLFEPVVIIAMGLVVGFVAIALVSAMYGIFRSSSV
jgi:type IV pilus assembly protein PilC